MELDQSWSSDISTSRWPKQVAGRDVAHFFVDRLGLLNQSDVQRMIKNTSWEVFPGQPLTSAIWEAVSLNKATYYCGAEQYSKVATGTDLIITGIVDSLTGSSHQSPLTGKAHVNISLPLACGVLIPFSDNQLPGLLVSCVLSQAGVLLAGPYTLFHEMVHQLEKEDFKLTYGKTVSENLTDLAVRESIKDSHSKLSRCARWYDNFPVLKRFTILGSENKKLMTTLVDCVQREADIDRDQALRLIYEGYTGRGDELVSTLDVLTRGKSKTTLGILNGKGSEEYRAHQLEGLFTPKWMMWVNRGIVN